MPDPFVLRNLVDRYTALCSVVAVTQETLRQREDTAYTLCVYTGTRDIGSALAAARRYLRRPPHSGCAA